MDKIKNLSLRKTIILYTAVSLVCSFPLSAVIVKTASRVQQQVWWEYTDQDRYWEAMKNEGDGYVVDIPRTPDYVMSRSDYAVSEVCDFLQTYTILLLSVAASCGAVFLFYRHKLKPPMEELAQASRRIAKNDLDFRITYENRDELGGLCREFERMRSQLRENNQALWRNVEEERALRAAIAHDIRSPLSVLKGYQEMVLEYLPEGTIDTAKAVELLSEGMKQIERMDAFVEAMRRMNSLESRELSARPIAAAELKADMQAELEILAGESGKKIVLDVAGDSGKEIVPDVAVDETCFIGDKELILEVMENLLSNALRYAEKQIEIRVRVTAQELRMCVRDDGSGFQEDAENVVKPFHQQNMKDSLEHAGLGMYISRLYCEKHGGKLLLENEENGGAVITAVFRRIV